MEYLAALIETEKSRGNWTGIKASREGPIFSHLFFTDDLLLFAKATKKNCLTIKKVLGDFYSHSGQKVSPNKSKVFFSPHTKPEHISLIEHELGMNRTNSFGKCLGVPSSRTEGTKDHSTSSLIKSERSFLLGRPDPYP